MNNTKHYKEAWEKVYQSTSNPFDIDEPYQWIVELENDKKVHGNILDVGCGAGHNSIFLASKGYSVIGVDISSNAIQRAQIKANEKHILVEFIQADIRNIDGYDSKFDTMIDIGCFHSIDYDDQPMYADTLYRASRKGAVIYLRAFSDANMKKEGYNGPAVSEKQIKSIFSENWTIHDLKHQEIEIVISENEKHRIWAWFAEIHYI